MTTRNYYMSDKKNLADLRSDIDAIDAKLVELISARARCAQAVADIKKANNKEAIYYRPEREAQVLRRIIAFNKQ